MKKSIVRRIGNEWCALEVELTSVELSNELSRVIDRLSICGSAGSVIPSAKRRAYMETFKREGKEVYVLETCGQIRDEIVRFFPEAIPYLKWHLNDMHAECEHQEARGESWTTHSSAVCPDCGYKLGSQWMKRELPANVVAWFESLESDKG